MPNDTKPLAIVIATKPAPHPEHVNAEQERWLLKHFNCTLMNNRPTLQDYMAEMYDGHNNTEAKFVIPIFGYKESWTRAAGTYDNFHNINGNVYYYNCGGTIDGESWSGLDEPGTRSEVPVAMIEQARAELRCVKTFFPGLKTVVTHPWPPKKTGMGWYVVPESHWLMNMDVAAWRLTLMENHMADYSERVAAIPELWAYLINTDFKDAVLPDEMGTTPNIERAMIDWASTIGSRVRAVGATTLLINDVSLLRYLFDYERGRLTGVGKALLQGCKEA